MTQYNSVNLNLSNSQENKLKSATKIYKKVILKLSSDMVDNSDDETKFANKLLLTDRQVARHCKAFLNNLLLL